MSTHVVYLALGLTLLSQIASANLREDLDYQSSGIMDFAARQLNIGNDTNAQIFVGSIILVTLLAPVFVLLYAVSPTRRRSIFSSNQGSNYNNYAR